MREQNPPPESEIPPAAVCAHCGSPNCEGCRPKTETAPSLAWESKGTPLGRLWLTSRSVTLGAEQLFSSRLSGKVSPSLSFAILAESLALTSLVLCVGVVTHLLFPEIVSWLVPKHTSTAWAATILALGLAMAMVVLHVLWGIALEIGIWTRTREWEPSLSLRFALYCCGWDLLTSPAGALLAFGHQGWRTGRKTLAQAVSVPRLAVRAYLVGRGIPEHLERKTAALSIGLAGGTAVLALLAAGALGILS